jgi:hypothetical protein
MLLYPFQIDALELGKELALMGEPFVKDLF